MRAGATGHLGHRPVAKGLRRALCTFLTVILLQTIVALPGVAGPYAPAPGQPGSRAIHMDDPVFTGWATGWSDYSAGSDVDAQWQTPENALGKAVGDAFDVVSLGRGGSITLTFDGYVSNGPGWDFAIFENSISDTFLELAYVEVSSDGTNFYRFDNISLTASPVGGFGSVDPTNISGYGGKYRQGYGTPFDLDPLSFGQAGDLSALDLERITHVRIVDIVGDGTYTDSFSGADIGGTTHEGIIYDPYPTVGSAGFDLDAVGVINAAPRTEPRRSDVLIGVYMLLGL